MCLKHGLTPRLVPTEGLSPKVCKNIEKAEMSEKKLSRNMGSKDRKPHAAHHHAYTRSLVSKSRYLVKVFIRTHQGLNAPRFYPLKKQQKSWSRRERSLSLSLHQFYSRIPDHRMWQSVQISRNREQVCTRAARSNIWR